ncbi:MAG: threonylcarbamoyl-AMP synthase [Acidobacteria bacterium]|nr:threonylcarbamoyl-AMP synthase [Acidobacteriota bacterium]
MSDERRLRVDPDGGDRGALAPAVAWLRRGGIVAIPTDTFYGLAVDVRNAAAVRRLFALKGRTARAALPLIASNAGQVAMCGGRLDAREARVAAAFWPGPLSLVRDAPAWITPEVHGGHRTVAIRVPAHAVARDLCEAWGSPVSATSANLSGAPAVDRVELLGAIGDDSGVFVVDAGVTTGGAPSTLVDVRMSVPVLLREGAIPWSRVLEFLDA